MPTTRALLAARTLPALLAAIVLATAAASPLAAQGRDQYLNLLAPPVEPIATVEVGGVDYLLVCNTPASRLEVWDPAGGGLTLAAAVPTGLKPVSVAIKPTPEGDGSRTVYTANWLGDSLSAVRLHRSALGQLEVNLLRTVWVGDEPMHVGFLPSYPVGHPLEPFSGVGQPFHEHLLVVFGTAGLWGAFHSATLAPSTGGSGAIELKFTGIVNQWAAKVPRHIASVPAGAVENQPFRLVVLNTRGGQTPDFANNDRDNLDPTPFDFDLWVSDDPAASFASGGQGVAVSNLGTTNLNMAIASNGDIYVVGQKARNLSVPVSNEQGGGNPPPTGEQLHRDQAINATGFVRSMIWRIRDAGGPNESIEARDLNEDLANPGRPVGYAKAVTQPTDLVIYGSGKPGTKIIVTGFNSDSLAVIDVGAGSLAGFTVTPVSINNPTPFLPPSPIAGRLMGPRGLALLETGTPANDRLFVYHWLGGQLASVPVAQIGVQPLVYTQLLEVRPPHVVDGQSFLFASTLSRENTVSCASCHIDGHFDQLEWNVADGVDLVAGDPNLQPGVLTPNPGRKGPMFTQSLRGLVNFEVADQGLQELLSNKPYHWRGDRGDFTQFNGAFDNLMAIPNPFDPGKKGLDDADMVRYRDFIDSLTYPPNPEQPFDRRYAGDFCNGPCASRTPAQIDTEADNVAFGDQAALGLKLFHGKHYGAQGPATFTCVSCHLLPEGSDNRLTETFGFWAGPAHPTVRDQSIETAALRFALDKEKRLMRWDRVTETFTDDGAITAHSGLVHTGADTLTTANVPKFGPLQPPTQMNPIVGISDSVFGFQDAAFSQLNGGNFTGGNFPNDEVSAVALYVRQFDTGVGPAVGLPFTVDQPLLLGQAAAVLAVVGLLESFVNEVDAGLVAQVEDRGAGRRGYRFDPVTALYREVTVTGLPPTGDLTRNALLSLLLGAGNAGDVVVFQNVPLGAEQRLADLNLSWQPGLPPGQPAGLATLEPMEPNSANELVPYMNDLWPLVVLFSGPNRNRVTGFYQEALLIDAAAAVPAGFGLQRRQFDVPRRFRVRLEDDATLPFGAVLRVTVPTPADLATGSPPTTQPVAGSNAFFELDLHPGRDGAGPYWETAVEFDPDLFLGLINGLGTHALALQVFLDPTLLPGDPFSTYQSGLLSPLTDNWYWIQINDNGVLGQGSWQRITLRTYP